MSSPEPALSLRAPGGAVFLSYASQDAEAVRRIAEALRASGVEVWFDRDELVGGDAWDAKIRGQIASCALFVPVISAATQARLEGYFRIEWKLAARRTHAMATAKAFLLPVVIDDTRDAEAHVPDEFRDVQWTRLPGGVAAEKFCARVRSLLEGGDASPGRPSSEVDERPGCLGETSLPVKTSRRWLVPMVLTGAATAALAVWQPWGRAERGPPPAAVAVQELSEAAELVADARRRYAGIFTRDDLALAETLARKATELDPKLARAWSARAWANAGYLLRGFAMGEALAQRAREAQSFANQALALDRNDTEAILALGQVAAFQRDGTQAEAHYRRALELEPGNVFAARLLSIVLLEWHRGAEAVAVMKTAVQRAPRDQLARLDLGIAYGNGWNFAKAWEEFDAAIALGPFPGALLRQASLAIRWKGDPALMRSLLERIDPADRGKDDAVGADLACALMERRWAQVHVAARLAPRLLFEESSVDSDPKAWYEALAFEQQGKPNQAREKWAEAEAVLRERLQAEPRNQYRRHQLAVTLARMGRLAEAHAESDPFEAAWREQAGPVGAHEMAFFYAACGDAPKTVAYLRQTLNRGTGLAALTPQEVRLDPFWDKVRGDPEFEALLANPPVPPAPVEGGAETAVQAVDVKSVAVLAFADTSPAKDAESFADGISDELTNLLGKIPGLKVTARTSSFTFKGRQIPIAEIAGQLRVAHVVEGSVQKVGNRVRITARLIKAADGFQLWSKSFEKELRDYFALQDEIAGLIAQRLQLKLGVVAPAKVANNDALELYLEARGLWNVRDVKGLARMESLLHRVLTLEPQFAPAEGGLAFVWATRALASAQAARHIPDEIGRAETHAGRALELDPNSAEALEAFGTVTWLRGSLAQSEAALRRAVGNNPNYATGWHRLGWLLERQGKFDEALECFLRARELDPLATPMLDGLGRIRNQLGQPAETVALHRAAEPVVSPLLWNNAAVAHLLAGRNEEALTAARRVIATQPGETSDPRMLVAVKGVAAWVLAEGGAREEAEAVIRRTLAEEEPLHWAAGLPLLVMGRGDEAYPLLRETPQHLVILLWLATARRPALAQNPRFHRLLDELGATQAFRLVDARSERPRVPKEPGR